MDIKEIIEYNQTETNRSVKSACGMRLRPYTDRGSRKNGTLGRECKHSEWGLREGEKVGDGKGEGRGEMRKKTNGGRSAFREREKKCEGKRRELNEGKRVTEKS